MKQTNCLATIGLLFLTLQLFAGTRNPVMEKQPSWVTATSVNYTANQFDEEAEDGYSDLHYEKQVSLLQQAVYTKKAVHILSEAGVQNQSEISVEYDPAYQSLAFHSIRIIRGGESINKLELSKIKTIQQEKELDRFLYNGSLTAVLFLEDVRKGDVIEYSYTVKGFNPIFKNRYAEIFSVQFGVPVYGIYYKLIAPKEKRFTIKNSLTSLQPVVSSTATETVYEWKVGEAAAVHTESNIPSWHDAYPMVMVSEFGSWKEVVDWAAELFPFSTPLTGALQKKVAEIRAKNATPEAQLLAALRFVQDDVRYMGVEMGVNSHKPHAPAQILTQRFGDCKDKSYLLCTLLRALGIEAYPVLINTSYKKSIASWQPTPTAFDHATVCVQFNGKTWWFDPTISFQRGPLQAIAYPDYQVGLVIRPGTNGLTTIPFQDNGKVSTKESFTMERLRGPAKLKVVTQYSGSFADDTRYSYHNNSLTEIKKGYKEFYGNYFKKLEMDSLTYQDDEATGNFITTEYYTVNDFWQEEKGKTKVVLEPYLINTVLKKPKEETRKMPYALSYPVRYHEEIEVQLPEDWSIDESTTAFKNAAFRYDCSFSLPEKNRVVLEYNYENLADHINAGETAQFLADMDNVGKSTAFELSMTNDAASSTAFSTGSNNGFTAAYVLLSLCAIATYIIKSRNRRRSNWE